MTLEELYNNPILFTDAYNLSHQKLKINTDWEVSHLYNRKRGMILYGFNEIVLKLFSKPLTWEMISDASKYFKSKNLEWTSKEIFEQVVSDFDGYPPIKIDAVPDGTYLPKNTPFAQISNSVEGFGELVTWWEGYFLHCHYASGCATEALNLRRYLEQNNLNKYKFHSFAWRSYNSMEDAYWGSTAWNLFLFGTDDMMSLIHTPDAPVTSIPALAHKVVQQFDTEKQCYIHAIDVMNKGGKLSMVIDTYNPDKFINKFQKDVMKYAMEKNVGIVFRPDSGNVFDQAVKLLGNIEYLKDINMNNYNQFNVIIGEEMDALKCIEYDTKFKDHGFDINKIVYGIGGGYHEHLTRKYMGFAQKTAYSNGKPRMKTSADIMKTSLPGMVTLKRAGNTIICEPKEFITIEQKSKTINEIYETIYLNNEFKFNGRVKQNWDNIKARVDQLDHNKPLQEFIVYSKEMLAVINKTVKSLETVSL